MSYLDDPRFITILTECSERARREAVQNYEAMIARIQREETIQTARTNRSILLAAHPYARQFKDATVKQIRCFYRSHYDTFIEFMVAYNGNMTGNQALAQVNPNFTFKSCSIGNAILSQIEPQLEYAMYEIDASGVDPDNVYSKIHKLTPDDRIQRFAWYNESPGWSD